jgi:Transglutaminase-like superfamily
MTKIRFTLLVLSALLEIVHYEIVLRIWGSGRALQQLKRQVVSLKPFTQELERDTCDAVLLATCFHWKPVLCLQRSACTAKLLRKRGINARVVIGYRALPFFSHAWVEVDGRVVYGSPAYKRQLQPLFIS